MKETVVAHDRANKIEESDRKNTERNGEVCEASNLDENWTMSEDNAWLLSSASGAYGGGA